MQCKTHHRFWLFYLAVAWLVGVLVALPALAAPLPQDGNLLVNGSMEGAYSAQDGIPQLQMPNGWRAWWVDGGGADAWVNMRPEWSNSNAEHYPERVQHGSFAMRYFKGWATFTAGAYQTVSGITPGTNLEFSAWGHTWSCASWEGCNDDSGGHIRVWSTTDPSQVHMKIGIDPTGGANYASPNIVWSGETAAPDQYVQFRVTATAAAESVTVFLYASQDYPAENQDAYWDNAVLRVAGGDAGGGDTGGGAAPSGWVGAAVIPTYEPQEDGRIIHTVRSGETLGGIAAAYGLESAQTIRELNDMPAGSSIIRRGQQLVVGYVDTPVPEEDVSGTEAPAGGGAAAPAPAEGGGAAAPPPTPTAVPNPASTTGTICVTFFEDANQNGQYDGGELLLAGGTVELMQRNRPVTSYRTDGVSEPHCFEELAPDMYKVQAQVPDGGYGFTASSQEDVNVVAGARWDVVFGAAKGLEVARAGDAPASGAPAAPDAKPAGGANDLGDFLADWAGVIVLVGCFMLVVLWAVLWFVRRR